MSRIESVKTYAGRDLESIFFRPMLTGENAEQLGIRVMYNTPVPTTLHFWERSGNILQKYTSSGWSGGTKSEKYQKTIEMFKVKAEMGYSAEDYFSMVYELITGRADVNMDDLSGTELEQAETTLFKQSIAESIRATMWMGDSKSSTGLNTFDGILPKILSEIHVPNSEMVHIDLGENTSYSEIHQLLRDIWLKSTPELKSLRSQGNLAFFVTSDIYNNYEYSLADEILDSGFKAKVEGVANPTYMGIPLIDMNIDRYMDEMLFPVKTVAMLTDRRNLALAVNTSDFPGTEVRMWYNPDLMENRQRAVFMAGADFLLPELVTFARGNER